MPGRSLFPYLAGALFALVLAANVYVFFTREYESSHFPASYATLYYPLDLPTIRSWDILERDSIRVHLSGADHVTEWTVLNNGSNPQTSRGPAPAFHIDTMFHELHTYRISSVPADAYPPFEIAMRFYPTEFYAERGMDRGNVYNVHANVPCGKFEQFTVADWVDDYAYVGEAGLAEARRILRDEIGIRPEDPTFTKMEKLTPFLRKKLVNSGGVPRNDERWMNAWELYNDMVYGTGKGWCTQNGQIYTFWANLAGIPTRFVFGSRTENNEVVYTGHAFAESFVREQGRWAFVDLSKGHMYITNKMGEVLNTVELMHLNQHNAFDSTNVRVYVDRLWAATLGITSTDTIVTAPFSLINAAVRSEFTSHSIITFRRPPNVEDVRGIYTGFYRDRTFLTGNLERYLFKPQLAYSFYPTDGEHTYFVRRSLFLALLVTFAVWIGAVMYARRRRLAAAAALPKKD